MSVSEIGPTGRRRARGLLSNLESGARVEARSLSPPERLRDVVERFWVGRWDLPPGEPHVTELLGDPCVHVVIEHGKSRVVGVWTRLWTNTLRGRGHVRAAKLRAGAVRAFFDVQARALSDGIRPLGELFSVDVAQLEGEVLEPAEHLGLERLAQLLSSHRRARESTSVARAVQVARCLREPDLYTVKALARRCEMSPRAVQRMFRRHVGASPKALLRRVRLQDAAARLEHGADANFARLAAELGYADQAHFARDFRAAVGRTPSEARDTITRGG
ncbi:MAG TPA: AraC family transcriptional regulator [Polyangiaceae bacterium]|nr:AraC family transcriptional regulator [Polyangiaceae bacterium]